MNEYLIKVEQTPESVVNAIIYVEVKLGDNFLEYRDIFDDTTELMNFAYEKKYISKEKFNLWKEGFKNNELGSEENFEVIIGEDEEYEPYCITYEDSEITYGEQYAEALLIYGELICSKDEYYQGFLSKLQSKEGNLSLLKVIAK